MQGWVDLEEDEDDEDDEDAVAGCSRCHDRRPEATLAKPRSDAAMLTVDGRICGSQTAPCADGLCDCSDAASGIQLSAL